MHYGEQRNFFNEFSIEQIKVLLMETSIYHKTEKQLKEYEVLV